MMCKDNLANGYGEYFDRSRSGIGPGGEPIAKSCPWLYTEEIAHRTVNEYTIAVALVSRAASRVSDPGSRSILLEVQSRLCSAARTQQALAAPRNTRRSDLGEYLQRLGKALSAFVLEEHGIFLTLASESIALDAIQNWRIGLIVFELVMNARRHAFAGRGGVIRVEAFREGSEICCSVSDNGAGIRFDSPPGRGSRIVEALATDLGGRVDRRVDDRGTIVTLRFAAPPA